MDLESLGKELSNDYLDLTPGLLGHLSGLSRNQNDELYEIFASISVTRRRKILNSLVLMSEENIELDFLQVFCMALRDNDAEVRVCAAGGLWETTDRNAIEPLINSLENDQSFDVRAAAAVALAHFVDLLVEGKLIKTDVDRLYSSLSNTLENDKNELLVRRRALEALAVMNSNLLDDWILWAYRYENLEMKQSALFSMGRSCDIKWMGIIMDELESTEPSLRYEAANAAREIAEPEALPVLHDLVTDSDSQVAIAAVHAIGGIGGVNAKKLLRNYIENLDPPVAEAAEEALKVLDSEDADFSSITTQEDYLDEL
tara:strand:+ start:8300 stop:9244 length:945 start_codon:yes stop_codon:yes gene_type:complete